MAKLSINQSIVQQTKVTSPVKEQHALWATKYKGIYKLNLSDCERRHPAFIPFFFTFNSLSWGLFQVEMRCLGLNSSLL